MMPPEPLSEVEQGMIALHELYRQLRRAGWGILAAAAYIAATVQYGNGEQQPPSC